MVKRGALRFAPFFLCMCAPLTIAVGASSDFDAYSQIDDSAVGQSDQTIAYPQISMIRVHKAARIMELYADDVLVGTIQGIQLGDAPRGHKRFEGDERTPEGRYVIDWRNENSAYHLSLHISYPNQDDQAYAAEQGRSAGGMIMIHGQPNGLSKDRRMLGDWTDGCIAVSNAEMEALWQAVPNGTGIEILP